VYVDMTTPAGPAPAMVTAAPGSNRHATRPVRGVSAVTAVGETPPDTSLRTSTRPSAAASAGSAGRPVFVHSTAPVRSS
jgi:hypothetical protein